METSMRFFQTPRIDLMQIHNLLDWRTRLATLREWKAAGRVRYRRDALHIERVFAGSDGVARRED